MQEPTGRPWCVKAIVLLLCVVGAAGCATRTSTDSATPSAATCGEFALDSIAAPVLQRFRDFMIIDGHADAAGQPHLAGHWLEYNYAGMDASLDTAWKPKRAYIEYELTYDGVNRVYRCTKAGTSGATPPPWNAAHVGATTGDGDVQWTYVGAAHSFSGSAHTLALGEYHSYYDPLGVANRVHDYLDSLQDPQAPRFLLYTRYARGPWRDTYQRPNRYAVPGWRRFPQGIYADLMRWGEKDGDASTAADLLCLAGISCEVAWSATSAFDPALGYAGRFEALSREVAYAGKAQILAERAGAARKLDDGGGHYPPNRSGTFLEYLVGFAAHHLQEWRTQTYASPKGGRFSPFMFGLTAEFLVSFHEWEQASGRDPDAYWPGGRWRTIAEALADVADYLFNTAFVERGPHAGRRLVQRGADGWIDMCYESISACDPDGGGELTALVAPVYGFVGLQMAKAGNFGEARHFFEMGDAMFSAGPMTNVPDRFGKGWFQQYYWSTEYLRFRSEAQRVGRQCR